jgi:hypothetical protein
MPRFSTIGALAVLITISVAHGPLLSNRQTQICFILPIAATSFNGNTPCGGGSVDTAANCECCPDGITPCQSILQQCQASGGGCECVDRYGDLGGGSSGETSTSVAQPTTQAEVPVTTSSANDGGYTPFTTETGSTTPTAETGDGGSAATGTASQGSASSGGASGFGGLPNRAANHQPLDTYLMATLALLLLGGIVSL